MAQTRPPGATAEGLARALEETMSATPIHGAEFLTIWWDDSTRIIGINWKETTAGMSDEQFKMELTLFASYVEKQKARGILVDVSRFRHKMAPEVQQWRVKHISSRYNVAGVQRFAFLLPSASPAPPMMNQSSPGEQFATRTTAKDRDQG